MKHSTKVMSLAMALAMTGEMAPLALAQTPRPGPPAPPARQQMQQGQQTRERARSSEASSAAPKTAKPVAAQGEATRPAYSKRGVRLAGGRL
jgi:hypothetical protein